MGLYLYVIDRIGPIPMYIRFLSLCTLLSFLKFSFTFSLRMLSFNNITSINKRTFSGLSNLNTL